MDGTPMEVSIALGILISHVTQEPFRNLVITFHEQPKFHRVEGSTLREKVESLKGSEWGGSTNFAAVFDLILNKAKENNLSPEVCLLFLRWKEKKEREKEERRKTFIDVK
jgi:hypothetical protein